MLVCAFRCSAIQGTKNPVERDFMWVCGPCGEVGWEGLEPSTNALKGRCSTIELPILLPEPHPAQAGEDG